MSDWKAKLIDKAEQVVKHGWGKVSMTCTNHGKNRSYEVSFTERDIDNENRSTD